MENVVLVKIGKKKQIIFFMIVRKTLHNTWDFSNVPQILHKYQNHCWFFTVLVCMDWGCQFSAVVHVYTGMCAKHRQEFGVQWKKKRITYCNPLYDKSQSGTVVRGRGWWHSFRAERCGWSLAHVLPLVLVRKIVFT